MHQSMYYSLSDFQLSATVIFGNWLFQELVARHLVLHVTCICIAKLHNRYMLNLVRAGFYFLSKSLSALDGVEPVIYKFMYGNLSKSAPNF